MLRSRSGNQIPIEDNSAPMKNDDGSLAGLVVVFRKRTLPEAEESSGTSAPLVGLIEGIADPLLAVGADWVITFANQQAARLFGKERDQIVGRELWDEFPPNVRSEHYNAFYSALSEQERRTIELHVEEARALVRRRHLPLRRRAADLAARHQRAQGGRTSPPAAGELESLGLLARGFAHDFNNLLTVLLGNISPPR